ncbi:MAG: hypothetical protein ACKV0T_26955 [Planctomycetales bacterium]
MVHPKSKFGNLSDRHQVLTDAHFWSELEYSACRWLRASTDPRLKYFWVDGFVPETIRDTRRGVDVEGFAWVVDGQVQHRYRSVVSLPQKLLRGTRQDFVIDQMIFDWRQRVLEVVVSKST